MWVWARMVQLYGNSSGKGWFLPVNPGLMDLLRDTTGHFEWSLCWADTIKALGRSGPYHSVKTSKPNSTALEGSANTDDFSWSLERCFCPQSELCRGRTWAQWMRKICEGQCLFIKCSWTHYTHWLIDQTTATLLVLRSWHQELTSLRGLARLTLGCTQWISVHLLALHIFKCGYSLTHFDNFWYLFQIWVSSFLDIVSLLDITLWPQETWSKREWNWRCWVIPAILLPLYRWESYPLVT